MAHLADLLGHDHPLFVYNLASLERAVGGEGIDTRLLADATENAHKAMRELGIDTNDTLASELYQALNASVRRGDAEKILKRTAFVLLEVDGEVISFNLQDVIENAHHELHFADRQLENARRHLRQEIIRRYAEHEKTDKDMVHRLVEEAGLMPKKDEGHPMMTIDSSERKPSMYAIGDMFSDVFIQLFDDESQVEEDADGNAWLKIPFGSKPPYESAVTVDAVGPSPNAGVSAARLGLDVSLLAWMGDDKVAHQNETYLDKEGINHTHISRKPDTKSNTYYVLRRGAERTILVKNEDYDYTWVAPTSRPDWVYLSLISDKSWQLHEDMLEYLDQQPEVKFAFQPGTFHFEWGVEKCAPLYKRANIIILNREEAADISGGNHDHVGELATKLHELGPEIVVITDGPKGSYASFDGRLVTIPNYPDSAPPVDRTGAGDAFASTIVAALALGESMETALTWAPINSMNVVQQLGAQAGLQTREQIQTWLKKAPKNYTVSDYRD